ncbi:flagella basal body P-ring formation protein FlgA [Legionella sp. CNM-4043-24]|uniref:flagella basal body P-ring formation protein FlgA n=1 Tax=Legionella sp. CNM-4043-24 TaxID=3421646 RepID=UPI00403B1E73
MNYVINILLPALLMMSSVCPAATVLRFQSHITPDASRLGDLLLMKPNRADWSALPLKSHPAPGEYLSQDRIVAWMTDTLGPVDIVWAGKKSIRVNKCVSQVLAGQRVRIHVLQNRINLSMEAIALMDGCRGQRIKVKIPQTHQRFLVEVMGDGQAEVIA